MVYRTNQSIAPGIKRHWFKTFVWRVKIILSYITSGSSSFRASVKRNIKVDKKSREKMFKKIAAHGQALRDAKLAEERRIEEHTLALREYSRLLKECKSEGKKLPIPPPENFTNQKKVLM